MMNATHNNGATKMNRTTRPNWTKYVPGTGWTFDADKARARWADVAVVNGVARWASNGAIPPADCCDDFAEAGCPIDVAACKVARDADNAAFVTAYRKNPPVVTAEAMAEMRAAYGTGTTVVDVISGRRIKL